MDFEHLHLFRASFEGQLALPFSEERSKTKDLALCEGVEDEVFLFGSDVFWE